MKKDFSKLSLALHKKFRGKIELKGKVPVATRDDLSTSYTPGVAAVSLHLAKHPKEAAKYSLKGNSVAVVSDGSAVLGLGNIGPLGALPVMEGKALLFKRFANIDAFPIVLNTQDVAGVVAAVQAIAPTFGGINLEDISAPRCFEIERQLRASLDIPVLHDDQHGTALVVLAGLINATKVTRLPLARARVVVSGAGAAGSAVAQLLQTHGIADVLLLDSKGIIEQHRTDLDPYKRELAKKTNKEGRTGGLAEALDGANIFIGLSKAGLLTRAHVELMADRPIIFAMANPAPEIMPEEALKAGAAVVATGRSDYPNQINNVLGFPGIFRGALDHGVRTITSAMLSRAAESLARVVKHPSAAEIIPSPFDPQVVRVVAKAIQA
ncbi:MAG: malate dehydrogenase [Parcubacteria group bacterium RIFOXYD2_FULL_52_8]|nr:MAG: malate dehydrogenase [Parcubacteria group bacterium RIFOXYD2_FULL_52_8]